MKKIVKPQKKPKTKFVVTKMYTVCPIKMILWSRIWPTCLSFF